MGHASGWSFNWINAVLVVVVAVAAVVVWQRLESSGVLSSDGDGGDGSTAEAADVPDDDVVVSTTTPRPTTTDVTRVTAPLPATTVAAERRVIISGEMKPCRFGANCLAASFRIEGFDVHPGEFVCVYPNSRRVFGFNDDDVVDACLTADQGDTITIEVDGVVSATISEQNLSGGG